MKVVYPTCCGVDVHKTFFVATIITSEGITPHYKKKRFSTFNKSILAFKQWLIDNQCFHVCMESTGKYWIPVNNLLEDRISVTIANPKWVKAVKGNKDDTKDSKWIGDLFRLGLVPGSFIPDKFFRILREYTRYRVKLVSCKSSEKNRFQNVFTVCNVALDAVVSNMFGQSASAITNYILTSDAFDKSICTSFLLGKLMKKADEVIESIEGFMMEPAQKARALIIRDHQEYLEQRIAELDRMVDVLVEPYEGVISLLCTIPGVGRRTAITIISEIGTDMSKFESSKRICSWAGLTPSSNESAGKKKSVRISRAGVYIKPALVEAAHAAVKMNESPYYKNKYSRISKRRGKKRAIIAIARMILSAVYSMMSTGETWNPCDLYKTDITQDLQDAHKEKAIRQAKRFLLSQGIVDLLQVPA